ncbi:MAG: hypothetical protein H6754_06795 [Candidatus Omnitrophica bacterium]|nr:hypothetical protein [Candidatus Omnitrophota bacterium]
MKELITEQHRHLLWKDELGDYFLLLKFGEVFRYEEGILRIHCFSQKAFNNLKKVCPIFNEWSTDDKLYLADIDKADLYKVIKAWSPRKRFAQNSAWLKDKEKRLAHRIIPYRPELKNKED